jgi:hypothetical protein
MLLIKYFMKIIAGEPFSSDSYLEVRNAMVQSMDCMMQCALFQFFLHYEMCELL